ncbi:MAG TPA: glycoside hydrolase family 44 protein [Bryobacteraceae bacterium]|nr:glycoside hydrolase family 44 protein [Bryobacteraceae bacterium]
MPFNSAPSGKLLLIALCAALPIVGQNAATSISVDANANRHPINPNIYGIAYGDAHDMVTLNAPLNRWGGNSTSRYNWQIDAHSAAADWYFETYSDGSGTASGSADAYVATTRSNVGAEPLFTIPMIDYLANLGPNRSTLEGFSVAKYGPQQSTDPWNADAGNGVSSATGKNITGNDPHDTGVANSTTIQQGWLQHFISTFGVASSQGGIKYYILDNEPSLWNSTHRDVHPNPANYQEMYDKIVAYASMIRAADSNAKIVGPEEWSWWAMYFSGFDQANGASAANSDYNTHNKTYYYPWLLQQLYTYQQQTGVQLLDVLSVHCYNATPDGNDDSLSGQQARNRETRILWDPNFQDPSWYGDIGINGRVLNWIPTLKAMVSQYYPGLEIGCTEYNWGDEANLNGATTQADVLGIYGREGFDLATRWTVAKNTGTTPTTYYVTYLASQMYRNYDGKHSTFGDQSVSANVANPDNLSAFAAVRNSDGALTVMVINKQQGSAPISLSVANFPTSGTAQAWQINSASQTSIARLADVTLTSNAINTTVPSQSITLFVIPSGSISSAPPAPTGLAATVGSGTVTLTWTAAGGATQYTVERASVTGGPYTALGTVSSPAPNTYSDTGLTNGTTYYYVVFASNAAGMSPNSTELAVTPIVPPTFTSTATASPNPVGPGTTTTVTATVTDTANTLTNGIVQVLIADPGGNTVASQNFTGQTFTANQSRNYTLAFAPANSGTFRVRVGVFSATWQMWNWNDSAASIVVNSSLTFSSSATATPASIAPGSSTGIAFTVTDTGTASLSNANVEMQVFDSSGNAVVTTVSSGQNFTGGQTHQYNSTWTVPASQATGTYTVMLGVFDSGWTHNYYWNSNGATITVTKGQSAPPAPTGLTATPGTAKVILNWAPSTGATSYNVYRGKTSGGEAATPIATAITTASYTNSGLANGIPYFYKVAAVNAAGTSPLSNEASATPLEPPSAPTSVSATAGTAQITLKWKAPAGANTYNVYRGTAAGGEGTTPVATGITTTSYVDTGLTSRQKYFYKVAGVNVAGTGRLSNEASATAK